MDRVVVADPWVAHSGVLPNRRLRLFCFAYAGGGASVFRLWPKLLPHDVEVFALRLPGRENRIKESPFTHMTSLVDALVPSILPYLDGPFAFFGHSLGALVSFELTRALYTCHGVLPRRLMVSACPAPQKMRVENPLHAMPDVEFIAALQRLNGLPDAVLQNEDLLSVMLPTLRADFTVFETYAHQPGPSLPCAISAFGGLRDVDLPREKIAAWNDQTSGAFVLRMLPGDHFFIHDTRNLLLRFVAQDIQYYEGVPH
ncbi:MAG: thioesterase [Anaerolineae bacterium]|nr:thioesterase [Anaerolineae bacterium]